MGCWGNGVFEGDRPYDQIDFMKEEAGIEIFYFKTQEEEKAAKEAFNKDLFQTLRKKFPAPDDKAMLAALIMNCGANLPEEFKKEVQSIVGTNSTGALSGGPLGPHSFNIHVFGPPGLMLGQDQIVIALKKYKNDGEAYDFKNLGLILMERYIMAGGDREELEKWQLDLGPLPKLFKEASDKAEAKSKA